jgi:hypothetical protein
MPHGRTTLKQIDGQDEVVKITKHEKLSAMRDGDTLRVPGLKALRGAIKLDFFLSMFPDKKIGGWLAMLLASPPPFIPGQSLASGWRTKICRLVCTDRTTLQMFPASQTVSPLASMFITSLDWERIVSIACLIFTFRTMLLSPLFVG